MTSKNLGFDLPTITTIVFAGLAGLVGLGCTNLRASVQQLAASENGPNDNIPIQNLQVKIADATNSADGLGLQEGMSYGEARKLIIQKAWKPLKSNFSDLEDSTARELFDLGYEEVKSCAGTGVGACRFEFTNQTGELLVVSATTRGGTNQADRFVWRWFIEKEKAGTPQPISISASKEFAEGFYVLGGTDQGLKIKGKQYRYYDESGNNQPWKSIADLESVRDRVIFDGKNYWCLPPGREPGVCSAEGWTAIK
jgi:hypothetical protein